MLKNRRPGEQASLSAPTQCYGVRRVLTKLSVNLGLTIATHSADLPPDFFALPRFHAVDFRAGARAPSPRAPEVGNR